MQRKSEAVSGWVNFPIGQPGWENSKEGGIVVQLIVVDNQDFDAQFSVCSGGEQTVLILGESLISDDQNPRPVFDMSIQTPEAFDEEDRQQREWEGIHFPNVNDPSVEGIEKYMSRSLLASLTLGTTGWSGRDADMNTWKCSFKDLTYEGKILYNYIKALYPGCTLHLLTFLDT